MQRSSINFINEEKKFAFEKLSDKRCFALNKVYLNSLLAGTEPFSETLNVGKSLLEFKLRGI